MTQDSPDRLRRELDELPQITASREFTRTVLARLDTPRPHTRRHAVPWGVRWALTGTALLAATAAITLWTARARPVPVDRAPEPRTALLGSRAPMSDEAMEEEYRHIAAELADLRRLAEETAPVLYLTSTDEFDVVLDLRPLLSADRRRPSPASDRQPEPRPARRDG